jgi:hypothetical protein
MNRVLRHLVLFRTRSDAAPSSIDSALEAIAALTETGHVRSMTVGRDVSGRGGFDVGLCADFASHEDLMRYLEHPMHVDLIAKTLPQVFELPWQVVDYWYSEADSRAGAISDER